MLQIIINLTDIYSLFNHILLFQMAFLRDAEAISKSLSMAVSEVFSHTSGMSPHHKFECFMTWKTANWKLWYKFCCLCKQAGSYKISEDGIVK